MVSTFVLSVFVELKPVCILLLTWVMHLGMGILLLMSRSSLSVGSRSQSALFLGDRK